MYFQPSALCAPTIRSITMSAASDTPAPPPEFSRPVRVDALAEGTPISGEATEAERAALARRYKIPDVRSIRFRAQTNPWGPGGWRVSGEVEAELTQTCVVTLEPVETRFREQFERFFVPAARLDEAAALLDPDLDESLEPMSAEIDIGEVAAEAAALAIDPYPRKPGAAFEGVVKGPPGVAPMTDEDVKPFARLAALRNDEKG
jgi:uncharacterized metal-binding protein YceD (DUF177 family)